MAARRLTRWIAWIVGTVLLMGALVTGSIYLGVYDVSAVYPDSKLVSSIASKTVDYSVRRRAKNIRVPKLDDPAMIRHGFAEYRETCVLCHGAPGVPLGDLARGLLPSPPEWVDVAGEWKPNELFWITKNGIRMTGMPAWGVTHSDGELWAVVAFMERLPSITAAEYKALDREVPPEED